MYSLYVHSNSKYSAFLLEGNGISIHEVKQSDESSLGAKASYLSAYVWAVRAVSALLSYNKIPADSVMCYLNNQTTQSWITNILNGKPRGTVPKQYYSLIAELSSVLNTLPTGFDLCVAFFNRAKCYATERDYLAQKKENQSEKAVDVFKSW